MSLRIKLRDWWRGYTNDDVASVMRKTEGHFSPGQYVELNPAEYLAWRALMRGAVERDLTQVNP